MTDLHHDKLAELVKELRAPKQWCCIFKRETGIRHGTTQAPFEAANTIEALQARLETQRELLERWLRLADSGHFRDSTELSLAAHPVADDTREVLNGERM